MSFLTAVLDAAGGFGRGRQQRFEDTQQQRQLTDEEAAQKAEENRAQTTFQQQQQDRLANRGIDPNTNQPFVLPPNLLHPGPLNHGVPMIDPKTGKPYQGGVAPVNDQQAIDWHQNRLQYFQRTGQTDAATDERNAITELYRQQAAQQTQGAEFTREQYSQNMQNLRDQYNQTHLDSRAQERETFEQWLHNQPTYRDLHALPGSGPKVTSEQAADAQSKWYDSWAKATTGSPGKLKYPDQPQSTQNPLVGYKPALIPRSMIPIAGKKFSAIDASEDPIAVSNALAAQEPNPILKALLLSRGRTAAMRKQSTQQGAAGGSEAVPPFQGVSYTNPVAQQDIVKTTPRMQDAFSIIAQYAPTVTSVMHGAHEGPISGPNEDPHYAGRAIDIGAFGGVPVGMNKSTWNALTAAIASGEFSRVGTIPELVNNPELQAFAKAHNVVLFTDIGTGPHAHMEVAQ